MAQIAFPGRVTDRLIGQDHDLIVSEQYGIRLIQRRQRKEKGFQEKQLLR
jgi:hypothetical protein